jgi:hypothetical protein
MILYKTTVRTSIPLSIKPASQQHNNNSLLHNFHQQPSSITTTTQTNQPKMYAITTLATLLLAASSAMASPAQRRQVTLDEKVRVILRDDAGLKHEVDFNGIVTNLSRGTDGITGPFTTLEVDVGADVDPTLRCGASLDDEVLLFATRGANLDDTFSDATNGEWTFVDGPVEVTRIVCDLDFEANNRNAAA